MFTAGELLDHCDCVLANIRRWVRYDAEDLMQETLLRAWRSRQRFQDGHLRPWLLTIARRLSVDHAKRQRPYTGSLNAAAVQRPPDAEMIREETACIVRQAVEKLLDRHRRAIVLYYFEGSRYDEIAAHLGLSVPGTKSLLARSRASLRRLLLESCGGYASDGISRVRGED